MYRVNKITFQRWDDAERERRDFLRRFGLALPIYTDCPEHGIVEAIQGHCVECMVEVYEEYLERGES